MSELAIRSERLGKTYRIGAAQPVRHATESQRKLRNRAAVEPA